MSMKTFFSNWGSGPELCAIVGVLLVIIVVVKIMPEAAPVSVVMPVAAAMCKDHGGLNSVKYDSYIDGTGLKATCKNGDFIMRTIPHSK